MKFIRAGMLLFLFSFYTSGANLKLVPNIAGYPGYVLSGSLLASDLTFDYYTNYYATLHMGYMYDNIGNTYQILLDGYYCPADKQAAANYINSWLSSLALTDRAKYYANSVYKIFIFCVIEGKKGSWRYESVAKFPPADQNTPSCKIDIAPGINLGTINAGQTTRDTAIGQIICDKNATVKISLVNAMDKSAPPGILRLDDAVVRYDVGGTESSHTWQVNGKNQQPFNLNFSVENTGQKIARKTGSLVLIMEAQ